MLAVLTAAASPWLLSPEPPCGVHHARAPVLSMHRSFQSTGCFCFCRGDLHKLILKKSTHDLCPEGSQHQPRKRKCSALPGPPGAEPAPAPLCKGDTLSLGRSAAQALPSPRCRARGSEEQRNRTPWFPVTQGHVSQGHGMAWSTQETAPRHVLGLCG